MVSRPSNQENYVVEHLATFSTSMTSQQPITPKVAIQRLFAMEKTSGIWTQRMFVKIEGSHMLIIDVESNDIVERFPVAFIQQPISFSHRDHMYDNILIFTVQHPEESQGELHIFQCVSHSAQQIAEDISSWMRKHGNLAITVDHIHHEPNPISVNVHVKETVNAFNALAAQREKKPASPSISSSPQRRTPPLGPGHNSRDHDSRSVTTTSSIDSNHNAAPRTNSHDQSLSNERYVSILNHCFDDIERFIQRLQHAAVALKELQLRSHKRGGKGAAHGGDGLLSIRARGPSEVEFYEILGKFKLAFNLLAKLKGFIHDPNAPELVHFLFTPLAIIIEAARMNGPVPIDPGAVTVPYLSADAIELLSNCCTSKETELWQSLGLNWTQPVRHPIGPSSRLGQVYQPVFSDGWAPTITEKDLMGFLSSSETSEHEDDGLPLSRETPVRRDRSDYGRHHPPHFVDSDIDDHLEHHMVAPPHKGPPPPPSGMHHARHPPPSPIDSIERDSPTMGHLSELEQTTWLNELQDKGAKIVQVLFPRTANNEKELTVEKGEILEILDSSRNWWKARNSRGQIAHVPNTIVEPISSNYQFNRSERGSRLTRGSPDEDWIRKERQDLSGASYQGNSSRNSSRHRILPR
ncbi:epidermal growth factor receptor kinase substrate 8-like isoform X2 [Panonychus citri]|uniref:epidermal growth factor receptor kinase substrate 8-like isoform X2 n=1 Tax=Panonychus citri TaxID=50023 RepID=UPI002307F3A8|nr:epidermal growth factor receptor kinase substrate 8-like isoform X2 [Panonychus citri]